MSGDMKFEDALTLRLSVMQPSENDVRQFLKQRPPMLTPGIPQLVQRLHSRRTAVYLISGGFRNIIYPIADDLDIPRSNVYANLLLFDVIAPTAFGYFWCLVNREMAAIVDSTMPSSRRKAEGKHRPSSPSRSQDGVLPNASVAQASHGYSPMVMIGDGATDLEARTQGAVDLFIGSSASQTKRFNVPFRFGGVIERPAIAEKADWFVRDIEDLIVCLEDS